LDRDENDLPDFVQLDKNYTRIHKLAVEGRILAAHSVRLGGLAEAISKMCFGNRTGFGFIKRMAKEELFTPLYGSIVMEIDRNADVKELFAGLKYKVIGTTLGDAVIKVNGACIEIDNAIEKWMEPIERIFPTKTGENSGKPENYSYAAGKGDRGRFSVINGNHVTESRPLSRFAKPRIFIPVFPGTNCEYDSARAFEKAGGQVDVMVLRNLNSSDLEKTIQMMKQKIDASQIVMIPGGFSAGDEPDGSGKFIATAFRNPYIREAVMELLKKRDGLMLGICNGFQALIKLGLVPFGDIRDINDTNPTLTFNSIGRHASCMVSTKVISNLSPWFNNVKVGDIHTIAISHGEGRFVANTGDMQRMIENGQIATQYVDMDGNATYDIRFNPNGSMYAVEGITSPDGRVLGKMGHSERIGTNVARNVPGEKDQKLFEAGVGYFR
jgi:phosphoribosylformylglycinamidine synthase